MGVVLDLLSWAYPWTLALHVIAVIAWMAGIFYLPRLFVYHTEKATENPELDVIYREMEAKLFSVIMGPAMAAAWIFGLMLVFTPGLVDWSEGWPWVKAVAVIAMTVFHEFLGRWRKDFAAGRNQRTGRFYRLVNEIPTGLMIVIVLMVVARPF